MDSETPGRLTVVDSADFAAGHPFSGTQFFIVVFKAPTAVAEPQQALQALLRTPEYKRGFEVGPFPLHDDELWPGSLQSNDFVEASFPDMVLELAQWLVTGHTSPASDSDVDAGMSALNHAIERFGRPWWLYRLRERDEQPGPDGSYYNPKRDFLEYVGIWPQGKVIVFAAGDD